MSGLGLGLGKGILLCPGMKLVIRLIRGIDSRAIVTGANVMEPNKHLEPYRRF